MDCEKLIEAVTLCGGTPKLAAAACSTGRGRSEMKREELIQSLRRLKVETGSLACLGCGHEHNCSSHGCAILREAVE